MGSTFFFLAWPIPEDLMKANLEGLKRKTKICQQQLKLWGLN